MRRPAVFALPRARERQALLELLALPPERAAPALLGQVLLRAHGRRVSAARIVETEAYLGAGDAAAHSFRGRTPRTVPLWGPPGTLYVYFIYGMHHCLNVSVDAEGSPGCVLIRAAEPLAGMGWPQDALRGPGRLCRALRLDTRWSGRFLFAPGARLTLRAGPAPARVGTSARVGIRLAARRQLRFFDLDSPAVTRHPVSRRPGRGA